MTAIPFQCLLYYRQTSCYLMKQKDIVSIRKTAVQKNKVKQQTWGTTKL